MNTKLLTATALAASLIAGAAYAQGGTPDSDSEVGVNGSSESSEMTTGDQAPAEPMEEDSMKSDDAMASPKYASEDERTMYDEMGDTIADFFTDDSMTTMKSDDEIQATFAAAGADNQAQMKAACDKVERSRGSYGNITIGLCEKVGAL